LIAVINLVSSKARGLVGYLLEPAMYLCKDFYAKISESNQGRVIQLDVDFLTMLKVLKKERQFYRISSSVRMFRIKFGFPEVELIPVHLKDIHNSIFYKRRQCN
jgi:hypothetical protein